MLKICEQFALNFDVKFNAMKSVVMRIGERFDVYCAPLILCGGKLQFVECFKYLGIQGGPRKVKPTTILLVTFECISKIQ